MVEATSSVKYWAEKPDKQHLHFDVIRVLHMWPDSWTLGYRLGLAVKIGGSTQIYHKDLYPFGPQCNDAQNEQLYSVETTLFMEDRFRSFPMFLTFANVLPFGLASTNSYGWILVSIVVGILLRILVENLERILVDTALPSPNSPQPELHLGALSCLLQVQYY